MTTRRRMVLIAVGLGASSVGAAIVINVLSETPAVASQSRVFAVPEAIEFRSADGGDDGRGTVEVTLQNPTESAVRILRIHTNCGCTVAGDPEVPVVEPGGRTRFFVSVSPPPYGLKETALTVETDASSGRTISISVRLYGKKLDPPFVCDTPDDIAITRHAGKSATPTAFRISCTERPGAACVIGFKSTIAGLTTTPPVIVEELKLDESTVVRTYESELNLDALQLGLGVYGYLTPELREVPTRPLVPIRVSGSLVQAVRAAPTRLVFSVDDSSMDEFTRRIVFISADDTEWSVVQAESDLAWIVPKVSDASSHHVVVTARPSSATPESGEGRIVVRTTHPLCEVIEIPVRAVQAAVKDSPG